MAAKLQYQAIVWAPQPIAAPPVDTNTFGWMQKFSEIPAKPMRRDLHSVVAFPFAAVVAASLAWQQPFGEPKPARLNPAQHVFNSLRQPSQQPSFGWYQSFDQPRAKPNLIPDEWGAVTLVEEPPPALSFGWFVTFNNDRPRGKVQPAQFVIQPFPLPVSVDRHDGVFVKRDLDKLKKRQKAQFEEEQRQRLKRREAIVDAIYGDPEPVPPLPSLLSFLPPNPNAFSLGNLPSVMVQLQDQQRQAAQAQDDADEEDLIEQLLRDA